MTLTPERWQQVREVLHEAMQMDEAERSAFLDRWCATDPSLRAELNQLLVAEGEIDSGFLEKPAIGLIHSVSTTGDTVLPSGTKLGSSPTEITPERWQQIRQLLADVIRLPYDHRPEYAAKVCGGDSALQRELESLIADHEIAEREAFDNPAFEITATQISDSPTPDRLAGRQIGAYHLEREIARGGMGTVWRAARADNRFQKKVAIKILDVGRLSTRSLELFRTERQILASLEHPNISRFLDAGETEDGLPYFVMEYVEGQWITKYCEAQRLTIEERLAIFQKICSAVHYAHQNLVIHRDLKPQNILVTDTSEPKLLDFGIAKVFDASDRGATATPLRVMTPAYASPEQICGRAVTTATDIYSLGLLLYELLTGRYAYEGFENPLDRQRAIVEDDPKRPSQAVLRDAKRPEGLSTADEISRAVRLSPQRLSKRLCGDLENIIEKAIRKQPSERYASVAEFSEDIRRHLDGMPVIARQDTVAYRAGKFIRRHKAGVFAGALVLLVLLTGVVVTMREAQIARAQRARAERRFSDVRKLANSLIFEIHDSIQNLPGATSARSLVVRQGLQYLDLLSNEAAGDPGLQKELAAGYQRLGDVQGYTVLGNVGDRAGAITSYRKALRFREGLVQQSPRDTTLRNDLAESYERLARTLQAVGEQTEADSYLEKAFAIAKPLAEQNPRNPSVLFTLGVAEWQQGGSLWRKADREGALKAYAKSADTFTRGTILQPNDARTKRSLAIAHKSIGGVLEQMGRLDEAATNYRGAYDIDQEFLAQEPNSAMRLRDFTVDLRNLGDIWIKQGKLQLANKEYTHAIAVDQRLVDSDPADRDTQLYLASDHESVGQVLLKMGDGPGALRAFRAALRTHEQRIKADPGDADAKDFFARSYLFFGDAYASLARSVPRPDRNQYLQNSCSAYYKASNIWNSMQAKGIVNKTFQPYRSTLAEKLRNCSH